MASSQPHLHELLRNVNADGNIAKGLLPADWRAAWWLWTAEIVSGVISDTLKRSFRATSVTDIFRRSLMGRVVETLDTRLPGKPGGGGGWLRERRLRARWIIVGLPGGSSEERGG